MPFYGREEQDEVATGQEVMQEIIHQVCISFEEDGMDDKHEAA